jgi:hypothetical protein
MSLQQLLILAVASMVALAVSRVIRVHIGRAPHPEGIAKPLFILGFLVVPPMVLGAVIQPTSDQLRGVGWVPPYILMVIALVIFMGTLAVVARLIAPGRSRPLLLLALAGNEGDPNDVPFDPPVTARLAESVAVVDRTNAVFPRGLEFPSQIDRVGFRVDWDSLDAATGTLEGRIEDDYRLGLPVASKVRATAADARGRLDTLRGLAVAHGQAWAGA